MRTIGNTIRRVGAMLAVGIAFLWMTHAIGLAQQFPKPGKNDHCPVCGMLPYKFPKWAAGFEFQSGARYVHCSPKCMVHNVLHIAKYQPGEARENIRLIWVTEYYSTMQMDAREVLFVAGSSLVGPMGLDLIPVKGMEAADNLRRDYTGGSIVTLEQVTPEILEEARRGRLKP